MIIIFCDICLYVCDKNVIFLFISLDNVRVGGIIGLEVFENLGNLDLVEIKNGLWGFYGNFGGILRFWIFFLVK